MKLKISFDNDELLSLDGHGDMTFDEVVEMAHDMLDEAISLRNENVKCSITVDSDKE